MGTPEPSTARTWRMLFLTLVLTMFWAMLCNATLDLLQSGGNFGHLFSHELSEGFLVFLISSTVIWLVLVLVLSLTGRLWLSAGITLTGVVLLGVANRIKLELRQEPLYPSDFAFAGNAGFLSDMVAPSTIATTLLAAALIMVVLVLVGRLMTRVYPPVRRRSQPRAWRAILVARVAGVLVVVVAMGYISTFNAPGNRLRETYENNGAHWAFWYQKINYLRNGFVAGALYNLNVPAMEAPEGYDEGAMSAIAAKYAVEADRLNAGRSAESLADVNIVVVLSEAFSDPTVIKGAEVEGDPIPFTRELMAETTSGRMLAQLFGGGTANMEFETLTGLSLSQYLPQMNTPYQMLVTKTSTFPSAVGYLNAHGHDAIAIHPYMTSMYKREQVYPTFGINEFVHDTTMQSAKTIDDSEFISDESAFDEVGYQIDRSEKPLLVNLVTMQNHYPMAGLYDDPWPVSGLDKEHLKQLAGYARGINHTDEALRGFIDDLKGSAEKTVVVFYGDHLPAIWPEDLHEVNGEQTMRQTPFFIWSNFADFEHTDLPVTSPIYFLPMVFNGIGAPLPPYYALLTELQQEIPAMELGEYFQPDGGTVDEDSLSPRAKELLHDYRLLQYDFSVGERYALDDMFYPAGGSTASAAGATD